ncbi:MAG: aromatic ring-hydroxylating dioxygenase subunit alpha [Bdellovibrionales bacterium]|nr:aromatic ring-hydroxylating dioxygenase subunit alpha [Bdellovibrionales bacterium]
MDPILTPVSAENWFVMATSKQLESGKTLARELMGLPIVLYRTSEGKVHAMEDRCPHKNVPLSMGKVEGENLRCRYHGWSFSKKGDLAEVPSLGPSEPMPKCKVPSFEVIEKDDWIWIYGTPNVVPGFQPPSYPKDKSYGWFELHNVMDAPIDLVLENGFDCSHTGFTHEGLFRSRPIQFVDALIQDTDSGMQVETLGEKKPKSRGFGDVRVIADSSSEIRHIDAFIAPHTLRVDYWTGPGTHIITFLVATPETAERTRVYTRMAVRYGIWTWIMTHLIHLLTRVVVRQDKAILNAQAETIRRFGKRSFKLVDSDQPTNAFQQVFRRRAERRAGIKTVRYKL